MSAFTAIDVAGTGMSLSQLWLDVISHNLANVNTVNPAGEDPFRSVMVHAQARDGRSGAEAVRLVEHDAEARVVFDPAHPFANEDGYVTMPVVDPAAQMVDMISAQRSLQMSSRVVQAAKEAYESSLRIGT